MRVLHASRHLRVGWNFLLLLLLAEGAGAASLTGVMVFSCESRGNPAGNFVWDTRGSSSDFYKVWLTRGVPQGLPDGLTGGFINGPTWGAAPINLAINEGTNQFTIFVQENGPWSDFALHLFFESNTV